MTPAEIRAARETLGLTQAQLARVMGMRGQVSISEWESGTRSPTAAASRLLLAYMDGYRPKDWPTAPAADTQADFPAAQPRAL